MAGVPPPEGMTEEDYDAIHAAVVETVRGRWFLDEYARRNRIDEVREMLAAIGRLESVVTGQKGVAATAELSPHMRLFAQRADEIAGRLAGLVEDLRESGADDYLCDELESQVRAIAALPKSSGSEVPPRAPVAEPIQGTLAGPVRLLSAAPLKSEEEGKSEVPSSVPQAEPFPTDLHEDSLAALVERPDSGENDFGDPRLRALAALDRLSLAEKLAFFA